MMNIPTTPGDIAKTVAILAALGLVVIVSARVIGGVARKADV